MAAEATSRCSSRSISLSDLSPELLDLIFKHLRDIDSRALADARQLSRGFEIIVTPIQFDTVRLNERIIAPQTETHFPRILRHLSSFTRHVNVKSDLDPVNTRRVLDQIRRLSSLRWRYVRPQPDSRLSSTPSDILSLSHVNIKNIRLYVEGLPLEDFNCGLRNSYLQAIPTSNLVSLKMESPTPPLTTRPESFREFLVISQGVDVFHYNDRGQGTQFSFQEHERLPAFKELSLRSYDWNHDTAAVWKHWDFSQIRHLTLIDVPLCPFLSSVSFSDFQQLEVLHCEDFTTHLPDRRRETTIDLYKLITQIRALQTLRLICHTELFPVDALLLHAKSLRVLSFRDYVGFGDETQTCPTMQIKDLVALSKKLSYLHTIELDMDPALCDPVEFLCALREFPWLDTLILHTQTVLRPHQTLYDTIDPDFNAVLGTLSVLLRYKRGRPWRRITINVGGWKPIMVRRISEAWRELNSCGIYAERCFVLERDRVTGKMHIRDEKGVDNNHTRDGS
ncbi:hypothetical protein GGS26DRAFT_581568 [Hypomontagnella submonticulosa]|nr:hypothetical protein GGS26DRAFT_581568 [Hypomontagnella submonticulosa]